MLRIDLHLHSTCSDGVLSPSALVEYLKASKVSVASLTDHDTVDGQKAFCIAAGQRSIRPVVGVELSASYEGVLHILGYRFDLENPALIDALEQNKRAREARNISICERLQQLGLDVTLEEARSVAGSDVVGRPHIARILCGKGYVPNLRAAFDRYLGRAGAAYVPRTLLPSQLCIALIRDAGGLPVLAHPLQTKPDLDDLPPLLEELKEAGLWGLECWSPGNKAYEIYRCLEIADRFGLYPTAGSDFHDRGHSARSSSLGVAVREDLLPWAYFCGGL